jgi:hypothetical protein
MDLDLRMRLGSAAGADTVKFGPFLNLTGSEDSSRNFQIDLNFLPFAESKFGPVFTVGIFDREHSGTVSDLFMSDLPPTEVDYNVSGLSFGAGLVIKADQNLHFEGKIEIAGGEGKPNLSTPFWAWNPIEADSYGSTSIIFGGYYTFDNPGLQLGLELGAQSFTGDFKIWNDDGFWEESEVEGSEGIINFVAGYRF